MDRDRLVESAERCEKATGPDRDIDAQIAFAFQIGPGGALWIEGTQWYRDKWPEADPQRSNHFVSPGTPDGSFGWSAVRFTASLDAAMTLVPEGMHWVVGIDITGTCFANVDYAARRDAATPALALCAAALRSHAHKEGP